MAAFYEEVICCLIALHDDKWKQAVANPKLRGWFVGHVMKACEGRRCNPDKVRASIDRHAEDDLRNALAEG